jgi:hypothetical protein
VNVFDHFSSPSDRARNGGATHVTGPRFLNVNLFWASIRNVVRDVLQQRTPPMAQATVSDWPLPRANSSTKHLNRIGALNWLTYLQNLIRNCVMIAPTPSRTAPTTPTTPITPSPSLRSLHLGSLISSRSVALRPAWIMSRPNCVQYLCQFAFYEASSKTSPAQHQQGSIAMS